MFFIWSFKKKKKQVTNTNKMQNLTVSISFLHKFDITQFNVANEKKKPPRLIAFNSQSKT